MELRGKYRVAANDRVVHQPSESLIHILDQVRARKTASGHFTLHRHVCPQRRQRIFLGCIVSYAMSVDHTEAGCFQPYVAAAICLFAAALVACCMIEIFQRRISNTEGGSESDCVLFFFASARFAPQRCPRTFSGQRTMHMLQSEP